MTTTLGHAGRHLALLLAVIGAAGCATTAGPLTCPERGGAKWIELASPHFRLQTDLPRGDAKSTLADFESAYGAFEALVFPSAPRPRGRVDLVLFQRAEDFTAIAPELAVGWFLPHQWGEAEPTPTIAMMGEQLLRTRRRFQHELLHRFLSTRLRIAPPWLEEGLAEYWSTLRADEDSAVVGELPMNKLFITELRTLGGLTDRVVDTRVSVLDVPTLGELLAAGHATFHQPAREVAYYAASWAFVHMLQSDAEYAPRLAAFVDDLAGGATAQEAWDHRFGDIPFDRFSIEFRDYVQHVELRGRKVALKREKAAAPATPAPTTIRKMSDADVHLVWARLRPWDRRENIMRAGRDFTEVRVQGPASPEALYWLSLYDRRWRRFVPAMPRHQRGLVSRLIMLASVGFGGAERPFFRSLCRWPRICRSSVSTSASHFAALARSMSLSMKSRSRIT